MNPASRRVVFVGLFVAIAIAIFGGALLAVGTLQDTFSRKVAVHTVFPDVGGLESGDNVWSSGMRVGVVKSLSFIEAGKVDVTLHINEAMAPFIPKDSVAIVGSDGLIGNPIIVLSGGKADGAKIAEGDLLASGEPDGFAQLLAKLQKASENLGPITDDIKALVAGLRAGEGTVGKLLKEDELYTQVQSAMVDVQASAENARRLTGSLATFSAGLNDPGHLPYDLTHDTDIVPQAEQAVADLGRAIERASALVDSLATKLDDPNMPVGALMGNQEMGSDLQATMTNLKEATVLLKQDLVAIQSNFLFRPYFRKQEREARKAERDAERAR